LPRSSWYSCAVAECARVIEEAAELKQVSTTCQIDDAQSSGLLTVGLANSRWVFRGRCETLAAPWIELAVIGAPSCRGARHVSPDAGQSWRTLDRGRTTMGANMVHRSARCNLRLKFAQSVDARRAMCAVGNDYRYA
jgi:hypothetical protein